MAGHHVREAGGDVKNKPPYLSQAGRPLQTLLTFSFFIYHNNYFLTIIE